MAETFPQFEGESGETTFIWATVKLVSVNVALPRKIESLERKDPLKRRYFMIGLSVEAVDPRTMDRPRPARARASRQCIKDLFRNPADQRPGRFHLVQWF